MGMDLVNEHGEDFRFGVVAWGKMLQLAATAGYTPTWEIWSNDGHRVEAEDAAVLASTLASVVDDIPDVAVAEQVKEYGTGNVPQSVLDDPFTSPFMMWQLMHMPAEADEKGAVIRMANPELTPMEFFAGENKDKITGFIDYCRRGAFEIW